MKRRAWRHGIAGATALVMLAGASLVAATAGAAAGSPSAPRAVHASGTATSIHLKWLKPASTGASPVREYVVTSKPLGRSCTTKKTSCVVKRLKPDSSYTFKVVAKNSNGASVPSVSNQVKVAKVSVYFRAELAAFDKASTAAESALAGARTEVEGQKALNRLTGSFGSFISALTLEHWPSKTVADMTSFVADTHELLTNTVRSLESTSSNAAADFELLQSVTIKDELVAADVFTDLGFTSPINPPTTTAPVAAALNSTQTVHDLYGDPLSVSATQVIDPATAAPSSEPPNSGYRFVAVELTLSNQSSSVIIDGDANYSTVVTGSDGQNYSADYGTVTECANFESGDFRLPPSNSASGCVVFALPTSVTVRSIQFTLAPNYLDTAEWNS